MLGQFMVHNGYTAYRHELHSRSFVVRTVRVAPDLIPFNILVAEFVLHDGTFNGLSKLLLDFFVGEPTLHS